jgi:hypothetical protein
VGYKFANGELSPSSRLATDFLYKMQAVVPRDDEPSAARASGKQVLGHSLLQAALHRPTHRLRPEGFDGGDLSPDCLGHEDFSPNRSHRPEQSSDQLGGAEVCEGRSIFGSFSEKEGRKRWLEVDGAEVKRRA